MPSEKGRIVAGNQKAIRRRFNVTGVSTGNVPTLPAMGRSLVAARSLTLVPGHDRRAADYS
jgi:hypothetical protein